MRKRLLAAALAMCLMAGLLTVPALAAGHPQLNWWLNTPSSGSTQEEKTPEEKQRDWINQALWYAWLSQRYATMSFADVPEDSWFYSSVMYVWQNGLMSGVSSDSFAPNEPTTRAMAWTVLARISGVSTQAGEGTEWYTPGVDWAIRRQLTEDGSDPMGSITREYLAEMLWKLAGGPITPADLSGFSDWKQVSSYAGDGVRWAVTNGILQGDGGKLSPQGSLTRAELAALVMRYKQIV